jgi:hypothetical protein
MTSTAGESGQKKKEHCQNDANQDRDQNSLHNAIRGMHQNFIRWSSWL